MMNNLIGISGKINSGKDTVGKILQAFTTEENMNGVVGQLGHDMLKDSSIIKPVLNGDLWYGINTYQIKKYADKLKDIVCLLIGCTREQLEDREFKEKELGEEWTTYQLNYTSYDRLSYNSEPIFHAEVYLSEKEALDSLEGNLEVDRSTILVQKRPMTPRLMLQLLGTDCGRDIIHPNIWVNALFADYKGVKAPNGKPGGYIKYPSWLVTDVRFENEAQAIKDRGGIVIRVDRLDLDKFTTNFPQTLHPSETALDDYEFDHVIENDGSIEELIEKVKQLKLV